MTRTTRFGECDVDATETTNRAAPDCVAATLCVDAETAEVVRQAVSREEREHSPARCDDYARCEGDHLLLQKLQRAEVSVCVIDFDRDRAAAVEGGNGDPADAARPRQPDCALEQVGAGTDSGSHARRVQRIPDQAGDRRSVGRGAGPAAPLAQLAQAAAGASRGAAFWPFWGPAAAPAPPPWPSIWAASWCGSTARRR